MYTHIQKVNQSVEMEPQIGSALTVILTLKRDKIFSINKGYCNIACLQQWMLI